MPVLETTSLELREQRTRLPQIDVVVPALPPKIDGIGDYTAHLAEELAGSAAVRILTSGSRAVDAIPGVEIEPAFDDQRRASVRGIADLVARRRPDWLLIQYNPFGYGRWGLNLHLLTTVADVRRRSLNTRVALMAHENFVPVTSWKFAIMTCWQRYQLWSLGRAADVVFFSIEPWARRFARWFPGKPVLHLPVSSNMPRVRISREDAKRRLGIPAESPVLIVFGALGGSRLDDTTAETVRAARHRFRGLVVLYVGPHVQAARELFRDGPLLCEGSLPPQEVSLRLSAADVHLLALIDGVSTRRTTLMAAMQHGLATAGTIGPLTDDILRGQDGRAFLLAHVHDCPQLTADTVRLLEDAHLRARLGAEARRLFDSNFSWPRIAQRLMAALT